jgi:hypothetical protein
MGVVKCKVKLAGIAGRCGQWERLQMITVNASATPPANHLKDGQTP